MKAVIIGAGIGGIATAIRLRVQGFQVEVFEAFDKPGGKLNEHHIEGFRFDAGPSLFTLPELVDELFSLAGKEPRDHFNYEALPVLCKYFYEDGSQINAWHEVDAFAKELGEKTKDDSQTVLNFMRKSEELYGITSHVFLHRSLHKLSTYLRMDTIKSILQLYKLDAFRTMDQANRSYFKDERVVQLFNRYATYNGSNPYQAPATLNIIPHLEHNLGAFFPKGGMYAITNSLYQLALELGITFHFNQRVDQIEISESYQAEGIHMGEEFIQADVVVSNMDIVPTYRKLMPQIPAPERTLKQPRSSSALIFYWGLNRKFEDLDVHNIFFSNNYQQEFDTIWDEKSIGDDPTIYVYVSSKKNPEDAPEGAENFFVMINVPPNTGQNWTQLIQEAREAITAKLSRMLDVDFKSHIICEQILDPRLIESRTSSYQGALYGNSSNNKWAAFMRHPNFSSKIGGLYFCGGSVHPGGGVPLCLLSAKIVGDLVEKDYIVLKETQPVLG